MNETDRFRGCLLGLAVGDAVGTTAEFIDSSLLAELDRSGFIDRLYGTR